MSPPQSFVSLPHVESGTVAKLPPQHAKAPPKTGREHWVSDSCVTRCYGCYTTFKMLNRRHHCRSCGNVFCSKCTSTRIYFTPASRENEEAYKEKKKKVCVGCFKKITKARRTAAELQQAGGEQTPRQRVGSEEASVQREEQCRQREKSPAPCSDHGASSDGGEGPAFGGDAASGREAEPDAAEARAKAQPGVYLVFEAIQYGTLSIVWSREEVEGALAYRRPGTAVPAFKYARGGRSELHRDLMSNKKNYFDGWTEFIKICNQFKCTIVDHGSDHAPIATTLWLHHEGTSCVQQVQPNEPFTTEGVDVVAALNENSTVLDLPQMSRKLFFQKCMNIGHSIAL